MDASGRKDAAISHALNANASNFVRIWLTTTTPALPDAPA
jgi:hypothetical protein